MKFSKGAPAGLLVMAAALCFCGGWVLRDRTPEGSYRIQGDHAPQEPTVYAADFVPDRPVDLNTASLADLMGLPGLGRVRAQAILDYRDANGPFTYPEDIIKVPGIGQIIYEDISDYITALPDG